MNFLIQNEAGHYFGGYTETGTIIWIEAGITSNQLVMLIPQDQMETTVSNLENNPIERHRVQCTLVEV